MTWEPPWRRIYTFRFRCESTPRCRSAQCARGVSVCVPRAYVYTVMVCAPPSSLPQRASCIGFLTRGCSRVTPHCVNSLRINCTLQALAGLCSHTRETRVRRVRCLTPIVCPLRGQRADKTHDKRARRAPAGRSPTSVRSGQCQNNTPTHTWLEAASATCRAHPAAHTHPARGGTLHTDMPALSAGHPSVTVTLCQCETSVRYPKYWSQMRRARSLAS